MRGKSSKMWKRTQTSPVAIYEGPLGTIKQIDSDTWHFYPSEHPGPCGPFPTFELTVQYAEKNYRKTNPVELPNPPKIENSPGTDNDDHRSN